MSQNNLGQMLRKLIISVCAVLSVMTASAQNVRYVDASTLTVIGKPLPTTKAFTRIDTSVYKFNDGTIDKYASYSTGLAVLFSIGQKGLDLYIMKDGKWVFAGVGTPDMDTPPYDSHESTIVADMAEGQKQCLLYLPLFDKVDELQIGIEEGAAVSPLANPFRHKIVVKGSSITHGAAASRPGMSYPALIGRENDWYCINLGFSGKSRLEKEYAELLADIPDVDAFVFDTFSNPSSDVIYERFDSFVDIIRAAHPGVPMIFLQTERRETRNFSLSREDWESAKQTAAEEVVRRRMKTDKHIYFISSEGFLGDEHIATADGTHPTDLGFRYMVETISPKIRKILKKYGVR